MQVKFKLDALKQDISFSNFMTFSVKLSAAWPSGSEPRGKNFIWALWSVVPQNHVMRKKGHRVRRCSNFGPKSSDEQKKGHSLRRCSYFGSTSSDEQNKVIASADV